MQQAVLEQLPRVASSLTIPHGFGVFVQEPPCEQEPFFDPPVCKPMRHMRWSFNPDTGKCEDFLWSFPFGENGNKTRDSIKECTAACAAPACEVACTRSMRPHCA